MVDVDMKIKQKRRVGFEVGCAEGVWIYFGLFLISFVDFFEFGIMFMLFIGLVNVCLTGLNERGMI